MLSKVVFEKEKKWGGDSQGRLLDMMSSPSSVTATGGASVAAYPSPHLKQVLRSYQSAASSSLSGPNGILAGPEHGAEQAGSGLVYYAYPNLPLPVVATSVKSSMADLSSSAAAAAPCKIRVKSEPIDEKLHDNCWPTRGGGQHAEYDEFKVLKLKRPTYYATIKDKDAVDLSSNRDAAAAAAASVRTATKPLLPSSPQQQQQQQPATAAEKKSESQTTTWSRIKHFSNDVIAPFFLVFFTPAIQILAHLGNPAAPFQWDR